MRRFLSYLLAGSLMLAALLLALLFILPAVIDTQTYRNQLAALVKTHTGRELAINGAIRFSVLPKLSLYFEQATLSNPPGFGDSPFASLDSLRIRLKLWPLLSSRQIEADTVLLQGLHLHLQRDLEGKDNWSDLARPSASPSTPALPLELAGLILNQADLRWSDSRSGADYRLSALNLRSSALRLGQPLTLDFNSQFSWGTTLTGQLSATAQLQLDDQQLRLDALQLETELHGAQVSNQPQKLALSLRQTHWDWQQQTLVLGGLDLEGWGLRLHTQAQAKRTSEQWSWTGAITVDDFVPRALLARLPLLSAPIPDGDWLQHANFSGQFQGDTQSGLLFKQLRLGLDDGALTIPQLAVNLHTQTLDMAQLELAWLGLKLTGRLRLEAFLQAPHYQGQFAVAAFNPRQWLTRLALPAPSPDDTRYRTLAVSSQFVGSPTQLSLQNLQFMLDEQRLSGQIALNLSPPVSAQLQLQADKLNLDPYLPAAAKHNPDKEPGLWLQMPLLHSLRLGGQISVQQLQFKGLQLEAATLQLTGSDGAVQLAPAAVAVPVPNAAEAKTQ